MLSKLHFIAQAIGIVLLSLQTFAYLIAALSNPGYPKSAYEIEVFENPEKNFRQCKDCKLWINTEERTFHCFECGICVEGKIIYYCGILN